MKRKAVALTAKQVAVYLRQKGLACPWCGGDVLGETRRDFVYDELNRMTFARNNFAEVARGYDPLPRLTTETQSIRLDGSGFVSGWQEPNTVTSGYDPQSNRTSLGVSDGATNLAVGHSFDDLNRTDNITADYFGTGSHNVASYAYFGPGRVHDLTPNCGPQLC